MIPLPIINALTASQTPLVCFWRGLRSWSCRLLGRFGLWQYVHCGDKRSFCLLNTHPIYKIEEVFIGITINRLRNHLL